MRGGTGARGWEQARRAPWRERGQASVELVAMLPVVLLVCLTLLQVVAAGVTRAMAGHAAGQGAIALAEGTDPEDAVRDALPGWSRRHLQVRVRAGEVTVRVRPVTFVPGLAERLTSTSQADAGRTS